MSILRYLLWLVGQVLGFAVLQRRPGLLLLIALGSAALVIGLVVQVAAPVAIYPFL